jgi:predicted dehydrogenase
MVKWGIIGPGKIAHKFVADLQLLEGTEVCAVASRSSERAAEFAKQYGIIQSYGSYTELMADPYVDIIYIATPHDSHAALSIEAMHAGKHILCEKPLGVNAHQVQEMINASQQNQVFLMEAFWSRFNPTMREILSKIKANEIGEVNYLSADFTFFRNDPDDSRMLNMDLAGGSLLDMGVYPVFLAYVVMGMPEEIRAAGRFHSTGADLQTAAILEYKSGIAQLMSGFISQSDMAAKICGTEGTIIIDPVWHESEGYQIFRPYEQNEAVHFSLPKKGKGYTYEIEECIRCIQAGQIESTLWSHQNSLDLIRIVDEIRAQINLRYPFE